MPYVFWKNVAKALISVKNLTQGWEIIFAWGPLWEGRF